jgi:hypothetical protein
MVGRVVCGVNTDSDTALHVQVCSEFTNTTARVYVQVRAVSFAQAFS